jgi:hypothetical protein
VLLNLNESPYDLPLELKREIVAKLLAQPWNRYPAIRPERVRELLAQRHGLSSAQVLPGKGSNEVTQAIMATVLEPGDAVVFCPPTFSLIPTLIRLAVARTVEVPLLPGGALDEAASSLDLALGILREVRFSLGEGDALATRGLLRGRRGDFAAARADLADAEALLRREDRLLLGQMLCRRAEVERLAGDEVAARAAVDEASGIQGATGVGPRSPLGVLVAAQRAILDPSSPPNPAPRLP